MATRVTEIRAASSHNALQYFEAQMELTTDCWDMHESMTHGKADFVLLDVRSRECFREGHVPGSLSLPHGEISEAEMGKYPLDTNFVVYCAGPHCNGAYRAAIRLARLGRPVKIMLGGVTGWEDEGFSLEPT
jgi:rhodanese-related sulfurtransferase